MKRFLLPLLTIGFIAAAVLFTQNFLEQDFRLMETKSRL